MRTVRTEGPKQRDFMDWFDIKNREHLASFVHFLHLGEWPDHFLPADVTLKVAWEFNLREKIVLHYLDTETKPAMRGDG